MIFSELLSFVTIAREAAAALHINPDDVSKAASLFSKARSIAEKASKYIVEYPVYVSSQIADFKVALAITKQVELECAQFIILASGLQPVVNLGNNETIDVHLSNLFASMESYVLPGLAFKASISENPVFKGPVIDTFNSNGISTEEYSPYKKQSIYSQELTQRNVGEDPSPETPRDNPNDHDSRNGNNGRGKDKQNNDPRFDPNNGPIQALSNGTTLNTTLNKIAKVQPTIINLNLILVDANGMKHEISVPLAIKAVLQPIGAREIQSFMDGVENPTKRLLDFIKVTTGQANFFKDILFQLDKVKNDVEQERTIGKYPYHRRLLDARNRFRIRKFTDLIPVIGRFINNNSARKDAPICTFVFTTDEIAEYTKFRFSYLLKNQKYIRNIMDTYMLLALGIVDETNDVIYFFFSGVEEPEIMDISKIGGGSGGDPQSTNEKLIQNLTKYILRK